MTIKYDKLVTRAQASTIISNWQSQHLQVGFTSGTFDILHAGHVEYLTLAKQSCQRLVVAINSDASVKSYKDPLRPFIIAEHRAAIMASLEVVDLVFIFEETNNNKNIELLKPDLYIKAGDYSEKNLSSAPLVKSYGGEIKLINFKTGLSTSGIIDRIVQAYLPNLHCQPVQVEYEKRPAVFLDRDGTLLEHVEYLHKPEQVKFFPDALEHLKKLKDAGYRLVITTNQPGIGLGYFTKEDFYKVNLVLFKEASKHGVLFDRVYFSPYGKADQTNCRKPDLGMIERAVTDLNIDLTKSIVIGDSTVDLQFAKNAAIYGILVETGNAGKDGLYNVQPDYCAKGLKEAVEHVLEHFKS